MAHGLSHTSGVDEESEHRTLRKFLQSSPEVRSEVAIQSLDESIMYGSEACKYMTKGARLALAQIATFQCFDSGETVCFPGQEMFRVFFVLHGEVKSFIDNPAFCCNIYHK